MKLKIQSKFNKVARTKKEEKEDKKINNCMNRFKKIKTENKMKNFVSQSLNLINTSNRL